MKPLQSPLLVGALVVVAVGMIAYQVVPPLWRKFLPGQPVPRILDKPAPAASAAAQATQGPPSAATAPAAIIPEANIELPTVQANAVRWAESPARDPFQIRYVGTNRPGTYPPAMELLTLYGVWLQTGSKLAVINNRIVNEGDQFQDYKIQTIEATHVWVDGPNGREQVFFKGAGPTQTNNVVTSPEAPTNAPPPVP